MRLAEFVERAGEGGGDERERGVERAGGGLGACGGKRSPGLGSRLGRQPDGVLEEGGGRGRAAAGLCLSGAVFELGGQGLVGPGRAVGPVPRTTVGFGVRVGGGGERAVDRLAFAVGRGAVDRRADERVAEPDAFAELAQVRGGRGLVPGPVDSGVLCSAPDDRRIAERLGGRDQQQALCRRREVRGSALETLLDLARQALRRGQTEAARELGVRQPTRELEDGQRVPPRLRDDPVTHPLVQRHMDR